ncbi:response regulator of RpoS [Citrobacter koseri]|nr:response regulator of RpoS [Citrobacter koseri]
MTQPLVGKQILIVEDEPVFRSLLDSWFSSLGATTALAGDGLDALELLGSFTPDLMICDLAMPRMNGLKLVEHLRNRGDQTPHSGYLGDRKYGRYRQSAATGR